MTGLKFYINDDGAHEWYDIRHYHSIVPACALCDVSYIVPFCFDYESTGATISNAVIEYLDGAELTLDDTGVFELLTNDTYDWIIYGESEVESGGAPLEPGIARLRLEMSDGDEFYSDYFMICDLTNSNSGGRLVYSDYFNLFFSSNNNLNDPYRIIYETGYENHHAFDTLPIKPERNYATEGETDEAQTDFVEYQSNKKNYQVEVIGGESLFDILCVLPFHEYVNVCWPGEDMQQARNIEFEYDWVDDYLCRMTIKFSIVNFKKGGCDTDFDLI